MSFLERLLRREERKKLEETGIAYLQKKNLKAIGFRAMRIGRQQYMIRELGEVLEVYKKIRRRGYYLHAEYLRKTDEMSIK